MAGIYLHIPFCKQACYYCDFHFSTNLSVKGDMIQSLGEEIDLQRGYLNEPITTIYFGGGTPSLAEPGQLAFLLDKIRSNFSVDANPEITLEANPDDLSQEKLRQFYSAGINRLSIGIQSFDDRVLRFLNRAHDSAAAMRCVPAARDIGFANISIDLIYAIPSQSLREWEANVAIAANFRPEHLSAYSLTIEEKTVFGNWSAKGKLVPVGDDASADQFEFLLNALDAAGYEHYEISNFALPGYYSRHNSSYWRKEKYLGIGPSAHSYDLDSRQFNVSNNFRYLDSIKNGIIPATREVLSAEDQVNDYLLTTLRTIWGTDLARLQHEMHYDLLYEKKNYVDNLLSQNFIVIENNHLKLTRKGKFLADKISSDLFLTS